MTSRPAGFERFVVKVHRRFVAMRLLERVGLGVLGGCAAGVPLLIVAVWRGVEGGPLAAGALAVGAVLGAITGILYRPTLHDAATEADRQLDTSDLLSTALSMRHNPDPWAGAVMAAADQWSHSVPPSAVILNRLGARAWGGIGLATALLLVLTLLPTYGSPSQAANHVIDSPNAAMRDRGIIASSNKLRRATAEQNPEDLRPNPNSPEETGAQPKSSSGNASDNPASTNGRDAAQGRGESRTASGSREMPRNSDATEGGTSSSKGRGAGGAGRSAASAGRGDATGMQGGASGTAVPDLPWNSPQWSRQAQQAMHAVDAGQVPDTYRDVLRDYFDRR